MKKNLIVIIFILFASLLINSSCKKSSNTSNENIPDYAPAAADFGGFTILLTENTDIGVIVNKWLFQTKGPSGTATNVSTVTDPFTSNYTYSKSSKNLSVLTFSVSGQDTFVLTWTSAIGGTFSESYGSAPVNKGVFTIIK